MGTGNGSALQEAGVHLRLFGPLRLSVRGEPVEVESSRGRALIGFLVLGGDGTRSREQAAFSLWPDSTDAQARTNLRKTLHGLRQNPHLEMLIEATPRTLRWRREETHSIDVDEFESVFGSVGMAGTEQDAIDALRRTRELYRGSLLTDCWDEWLLDHRSRLGELHIAGLRRLAEMLRDTGDTAEAIQIGHEIVRVEPLQESSYRLLMGLYRESGDRAAAARVYHQCVNTLLDELGVTPSIETATAYNELTSTPADSKAAMPSPAGRKAAGPLVVGRDAEWDALTSLWPGPGGATAHLVVLTGEPGIGKTHLADAFSSWAARRGALVSEARSFSTEGDLGFGLVISWLRSPALRETIESLPEADRLVLAHLLPELGHPADDLPLDPAERRQRIYDVIARVFRGHGSDRVLVLVADDAQWADEQSLQATQYTVRADADARVLVLATVRREDLAPHAPIDTIANELASLALASELPIGRLDRAGTEALAGHLIDDEVSARGIDQLHADSEGNPLFIVEAIRAGWGPDQPEVPVSPRLRQVIDARVGQLSDEARTMLHAAVAVGREFRVPVVQRAAGLDDLAAVRALDELWRRGFVDEYSVDAYDFTHGRIRDVVYDGLSPAIRRANHRRIAAAHCEVDAGSLDNLSGRIAYHLDQGGQPDEAVSWYLRAADQAQRLFATEEAIRLLERALDLVAGLPDDRRLSRELEVLSALPSPLGLVHGFSSERVVSIQERAVEIAGHLGIDPEPTILRALVFIRLCQNRYGDAGDLGRRLGAVAASVDDRGLLLEAAYIEGVAAFWDGAFDIARERFEHVVHDYAAPRAEHLIRFGQDSQIISRSRLANTLRFQGEIDAAIATRDIAVAEAIEFGHPQTLCLTLIFASMLAVDLHERDRLQEYVGLMSSLHLDSRPFRLHHRATSGADLALRGHPHDGIAMVRGAIDECGPINPAPGILPSLWRLLVGAHEAAGPSVGGGVEACDRALQVEGSRIWWPDIEQARSRLAVPQR